MTEQTHTPLRTIRVDDELWETAKERSGNMSELVRTLLSQYIEHGHPYTLPQRNIHKREWHPYSHMIVRTYHEDGEFLRHDLYVWSARHGTYKTDRGLRKAILREAETPRIADGALGTPGTWEL